MDLYCHLVLNFILDIKAEKKRQQFLTLSLPYLHSSSAFLFHMGMMLGLP